MKDFSFFIKKTYMRFSLIYASTHVLIGCKPVITVLNLSSSSCHNSRILKLLSSAYSLSVFTIAVYEIIDSELIL